MYVILEELGHEMAKTVIKSGKEIIRVGGEIITQTVIDYLRTVRAPDTNKSQQCQDHEHVILSILTETPIHIDELHYKSQIPVGKLSGLLLQLEMSGKVKQHAGQLFSLSKPCII
jgi:predicted Rossmann fold nucleotide-binding protein DprA/Smf involved in DNA uptake